MSIKTVYYLQAHPEWRWCAKERRKSSTGGGPPTPSEPLPETHPPKSPSRAKNAASSESAAEDLKCKEKMMETEQQSDVSESEQETAGTTNVRI